MESSQAEVAILIEGARQEEENELPPKYGTKQKRSIFSPLGGAFSKVRQAQNEEKRREGLPEQQQTTARQQPPALNEPSKKIDEASSMPPVWRKARDGDDAAADDDLEAKYSIDFAPSFNMKDIRHKFIRKVYLLLTVQLALTALVIALVLAEPHVNIYILINVKLGTACIVIALIMCLILLTLDSTRKNFLLNLILLCAYTCFASIGFATIAATYAPYLILSAVAITLVIFALITLLAWQNWIDITSFWGCLVVLIVLIILVTAAVLVVDVLFGYDNCVYNVYAGLFIAFVSAYFFYITQLIIGEKWYKLSPEEYIFAVMLLYTGIIRLVLALLGVITFYKD